MKFLLTSILFVFSLSAGQIHQISTVSQIEEHLNGELRSALMVWDIDLTLTAPANPAYQYPTFRQYNESFRALINSWSDEHLERVMNRCALDEDLMLIEEQTPAMIQKWQARGLPMMAHTAALSSPIGAIKEPITKRVEHLEKFGIDFSSSWNDQRVVLRTIEPYLGGQPIFYRGVLINNGSMPNKGEVLVKFLHRMDRRPTKIFFIDDKLKSLESVVEALDDAGIECIAFHYKGCSVPEPAPLTEEEVLSAWQTLYAEVSAL